MAIAIKNDRRHLETHPHPNLPPAGEGTLEAPRTIVLRNIHDGYRAQKVYSLAYKAGCRNLYFLFDNPYSKEILIMQPQSSHLPFEAMVTYSYDNVADVDLDNLEPHYLKKAQDSGSTLRQEIHDLSKLELRRLIAEKLQLHNNCSLENLSHEENKDILDRWYNYLSAPEQKVLDKAGFQTVWGGFLSLFPISNATYKVRALNQFYFAEAPPFPATCSNLSQQDSAVIKWLATGEHIGSPDDIYKAIEFCAQNKLLDVLECLLRKQQLIKLLEPVAQSSHENLPGSGPNDPALQQFISKFKTWGLLEWKFVMSRLANGEPVSISQAPKVAQACIEEDQVDQLLRPIKEQNLTSFDIGECVLYGSDMVAVAKALEGNQTARSLTLHINNLNENNVEVLANAFKKNQVLETVNLTIPGITRNAFAILVNSLIESKTLKTLILSGIDDGVLAVLAERLSEPNTELKSLTIADSVGEADTLALLSMLNTNNSINSLTLRNSPLAALHSSHKKCLDALTEAIAKNKTLTSLDISGQNTISTTLFAICKALQNNDHLQTLTYYRSNGGYGCSKDGKEISKLIANISRQRLWRDTAPFDVNSPDNLVEEKNLFIQSRYKPNIVEINCAMTFRDSASPPGEAYPSDVMNLITKFVLLVQ